MEFLGKHYETGTVVNALSAAGVLNPKTNQPYTEALALGASGGITFGYFTFEYKGWPPHVSILTRNTFSPFERALDNLAIRRESRETVQESKGEENLQRELDCGNVPIVFADIFSLEHRGPVHSGGMWMSVPMPIVGREGGEYLLADGRGEPVRVPAAELLAARGRIKKDRFKLMVLEPPNIERLPDGLKRGIETCIALFIDKPPAGSPSNWGIKGMQHWNSLLLDSKSAKSWAKQFPPGSRFVQAIAGSPGQPGVWDWIETWGTNPAADRATFAAFLREAAVWLVADFEQVAQCFDRSAKLWRQLAEAALPDSIPGMSELKNLKRTYSACRDRQSDLGSTSRSQMAEITTELADSKVLADHHREICSSLANLLLQISDLEEEAIRTIKAILVE